MPELVGLAHPDHQHQQPRLENNLHPIVYLGRSDQDSHTVIAPIFWDFVSPTDRTTIAAPLFWRFHNAKAGTITQIAANTIYREHRVDGGKDWQFHVAPLLLVRRGPAGVLLEFPLRLRRIPARGELRPHPRAVDPHHGQGLGVRGRQGRRKHQREVLTGREGHGAA